MNIDFFLDWDMCAWSTTRSRSLPAELAKKAGCAFSNNRVLGNDLKKPLLRAKSGKTRQSVDCNADNALAAVKSQANYSILCQEAKLVWHRRLRWLEAFDIQIEQRQSKLSVAKLRVIPSVSASARMIVSSGRGFAGTHTSLPSGAMITLRLTLPPGPTHEIALAA